eukprot:gene295-34888_t
MPPVVCEETTVGVHIDSLFGKVTWQSGLLVGRVGSKKQSVVGIVPTPDPDGGDGQGDAKAAVNKLDTAWASDFAVKVRQTLPGGLDVIGAYIFCPRDVDPTTKLRQLSYAVSSPAAHPASSAGVVDQFRERGPGEGGQQVDRLALHICASTKKITCRSYNVSDHKASPKPCDWKIQNAEVDAVVSVANAAAVAGGGAAGTFASGVLAAMAPTIAQFSTATIVAAKATVGSNPQLSFDVFVRPACATTAPHSGGGGSGGSAAVTRLSVLCESLEDEDGGADDSWDGLATTSLPARAETGWAGQIKVSDYRFPDDEEGADSAARLKELLGIEATQSDFDCAEQALPCLQQQLGWS